MLVDGNTLKSAISDECIACSYFPVHRRSPQQDNVYDCGLFMLHAIEVRSGPFRPRTSRTTLYSDETHPNQCSDRELTHSNLISLAALNLIHYLQHNASLLAFMFFDQVIANSESPPFQTVQGLVDHFDRSHLFGQEEITRLRCSFHEDLCKLANIDPKDELN